MISAPAFAGSYSGQYTGGFNGEWSLKIEETGFYSGMIQSHEFAIITGEKKRA